MQILSASGIVRSAGKDVVTASGHLVEENAMNDGFIPSKCAPVAVELFRAVVAEREVAEPMSTEFEERHRLRAVSSVRFVPDILLKDELFYRRDDGYVVYDRLFVEWVKA